MSGISADTEPTLAERFRTHFSGEQHLYWHLARAMADDIEAGGMTADIVEGWHDAPRGAVIQLRVLAGLFREVLSGRADELAPFYPCLGGLGDPAAAWPVAHRALTRSADRIRQGLDVAPQTNEPGRSAALLVGLVEAVRRTGIRRVRLLEPGASAGLNLLIDRYRFEGDDWSFGPADASCRIDGVGASGLRIDGLDVQIVERRGCDAYPIDAASEEGALRLRSFVWPFMIERHQRLAGALAIARSHPVAVDEDTAAAWLARQLAEPTRDVLTVVWQSITGQYWPPTEATLVAEVLDDARARMPLAHVAMEATDGAFERVVDHSGGLPVVTVDGDAVAVCDFHGPPVTLLT